MDQEKIFITILGMSLVTYIPRFLPVWFLSSRPLPAIVRDWLKQVPPAVMAAMLLPALVVRDGSLDVTLSNLYLLAAVPTFLTAFISKSLFGAVIVGMGIVAAARYWGGM